MNHIVRIDVWHSCFTGTVSLAIWRERGWRPKQVIDYHLAYRLAQEMLSLMRKEQVKIRPILAMGCCGWSASRIDNN